tara:strand:- start:166143 stop:166364 length:222 start_codon:yes stop_codon:yes gene_type:complete
MNAAKLIGVILIVAGVLGLVYGSFSYTKETHQAKLGPLQFELKEEETINIPIWASVASIAAGSLLLLFGNKKG